MNDTNLLLVFIAFLLLVLLMYVRWIYLRLEYGKLFDPHAPTNMYGEGLSEGIQNAIVRGQCGIHTHDR
ncbi:hypothetical protein [Bradyrhizobium sp. 33ap4]|uniref:hypothetical protein n=1 Tax=Bradyrhizobium sp. 33ap4 TaxID=3061630 RepID=UPI0029314796|nr:hypothetical protein [Bradyrhizobium sp. 33ap4]